MLCLGNTRWKCLIFPEQGWTRARNKNHCIKPFQCNCKYIYMGVCFIHLCVHFSVNHIKCPLCDMTCTSLSTLKIHIKFRHCDERPFPCDFCESRLANYLPHLKFLLLSFFYIYKTNGTRMRICFCFSALRISMICGSTWRLTTKERLITAQWMAAVTLPAWLTP